MVVKIRLARFGRTRQPIYNIVVAQARSARGSKPMEVLGTYDPIPRTPLATNEVPDTTTDPSTGKQIPYHPKRYKDIVLDTTRTKYWLGVGAQPSEPVERLLSMMGLIEPSPSRAKKMGVKPIMQASAAATSSMSSSSATNTTRSSVQEPTTNIS